MTRLERNIKKRRRRRAIFFSWVLVLALFISGIWMTNRVMVEMTGLNSEDNILGIESISQYISEWSKLIPVDNWRKQVQIVLERGFK